MRLATINSQQEQDYLTEVIADTGNQTYLVECVVLTHLPSNDRF